MLAQKTGASTHACAKGFAQAHMLAPKALRKHRCLHQKLCASTHACTKLLAQAQMLAPKVLCKHRCLRQKPCLVLRAGGVRRARPRRLATKHRRRPSRCWGHTHWRRDGPDLGPETKRTWDPELCIIIYLMQADLGPGFPNPTTVKCSAPWRNKTKINLGEIKDAPGRGVSVRLKSQPKSCGAQEGPNTHTPYGTPTPRPSTVCLPHSRYTRPCAAHQEIEGLLRKLYNGTQHETEKQRMDHFMKQTSCSGFVCFIEWSILIRKLKDSGKLYNDPQSKTKKQRMDHFMKQTSCFGFFCFIEWSILCFFVLVHKMIYPLLLRFAS
jgi:hypothetical protein